MIFFYFQSKKPFMKRLTAFRAFQIVVNVTCLCASIFFVFCSLETEPNAFISILEIQVYLAISGTSKYMHMPISITNSFQSFNSARFPQLFAFIVYYQKKEKCSYLLEAIWLIWLIAYECVVLHSICSFRRCSQSCESSLLSCIKS